MTKKKKAVLAFGEKLKRGSQQPPAESPLRRPLPPDQSGADGLWASASAPEAGLRGFGGADGLSPSPEPRNR